MKNSRLRQSLETNTMFRTVFANHRELCVLSDNDSVRLQNALTDMISDIDVVCRKYGLTYFLAGGNALGAVRCGGFIPWDDDADIILPRKDYMWLPELLEKEFPGRYYVQSVYSGKNYDVNFAKIRKNGTVYRELFECEPEKAGIFVDIYPLENVPENSVLRKLNGIADEILLLICSCVRMRKNQPLILPYLTEEEQKKTVRLKTAIGKTFSFFSPNTWARIAEKPLGCCRNDKSTFVSIPSGRKHYFGEMYSRSSFFPAKETDFNGHRFFIMNDPDEYLTKLYGSDYLTPPENENEKERHAVREFFLP